MSYVYEKRGSNFGLGVTPEPLPTPFRVAAIPEPIPTPLRLQYDPTAMRNIDPAPAAYTLEVSQVAPMNVEQAPYFNERIVAGPTPTIESTLSVLDAPTSLATRSLSTPEAQLRTAQESLQQVLQPMRSVDTRYADPSLFTDVDVRPTLMQSEMPTELQAQPPREMPSNFVSEPTQVMRSSLSPVLDMAPTEPTVTSAMQEARDTNRLALSTSSNYETMTPTSQPASQRGESLFDDPHPNLLEPVVTQSPVTGTKYETLFPPRTDVVSTESDGGSQGACPAGWIENAPGSCSAPAGSGGGTPGGSVVPKPKVVMPADIKAQLQKLAVQVQGDLKSRCPSFNTTLITDALAVGNAIVDKFYAGGITNDKQLLTLLPTSVQQPALVMASKLANAYLLGDGCVAFTAAIKEAITLGSQLVGSVGGSSLPLIAGAAALALLLFRR